jgi:hypothetical protein
MHEQRKKDEDRQRDADQPEKNTFAEAHLNSPALMVSSQPHVFPKVPANARAIVIRLPD